MNNNTINNIFRKFLSIVRLPIRLYCFFFGHKPWKCFVWNHSSPGERYEIIDCHRCGEYYALGYLGSSENMENYVKKKWPDVRYLYMGCFAYPKAARDQQKTYKNQLEQIVDAIVCGTGILLLRYTYFNHTDEDPKSFSIFDGDEYLCVMNFYEDEVDFYNHLWCKDSPYGCSLVDPDSIPNLIKSLRSIYTDRRKLRLV
jgi:hypothetical protein